MAEKSNSELVKESDFTFEADPNGKSFALTIARVMVQLFDIPLAEAIGKTALNRGDLFEGTKRTIWTRMTRNYTDFCRFLKAFLRVLPRIPCPGCSPHLGVVVPRGET